MKKKDIFVDVSERDSRDLPDGIYHVTLSAKGTEYRAEKRNGKWFLSDGTGWEEPFLREQEFRAVRFYPNAKDPRLNPGAPHR